jgi:methylmalonyl-CoA/ethylmalonyl-CoA epimerase
MNAATAADPPAGWANDLGLLRIDHVGVAVPDLDAAIALHERVFGMRCVHTETNAEQGVREAMLAVGGPGGGYLQLLAPLDARSPIAAFLDRRGPGLQQVAYTVADVDAACAALRSRGVRVLYDTARRGTAGSRINFVHPRDAAGVLVELVEPAAGDPAPPA